MLIFNFLNWAIKSNIYIYIYTHTHTLFSHTNPCYLLLGRQIKEHNCTTVLNSKKTWPLPLWEPNVNMVSLCRNFFWHHKSRITLATISTLPKLCLSPDFFVRLNKTFFDIMSLPTTRPNHLTNPTPRHSRNRVDIAPDTDTMTQSSRGFYKYPIDRGWGS